MKNLRILLCITAALLTAVPNAAYAGKGSYTKRAVIVDGKRVTKWFGLGTVYNKEYTSETGVITTQATEAIKALSVKVPVDPCAALLADKATTAAGEDSKYQAVMMCLVTSNFTEGIKAALNRPTTDAEAIALNAQQAINQVQSNQTARTKVRVGGAIAALNPIAAAVAVVKMTDSNNKSIQVVAENAGDTTTGDINLSNNSYASSDSNDAATGPGGELTTPGSASASGTSAANSNGTFNLTIGDDNTFANASDEASLLSNPTGSQLLEESANGGVINDNTDTVPIIDSVGAPVDIDNNPTVASPGATTTVPASGE